MDYKKIDEMLQKLDEDLIDEAVNAGPVKKSFGRKYWPLIAAACACVIIGLSVGWYVNHGYERNPDRMIADKIEDEKVEQETDSFQDDQETSVTELAYAPDGLQKIELIFQSGDMGYEGLLYHNVGELKSLNAGCAWDESMDFDMMPVYKDNAHNQYGDPIALDEKAMLELVQRIAEKLGTEIIKIEKETIKREESFVTTAIIANTEIADIRVSADGDISINFERAYNQTESCIKLPEYFQFTEEDSGIQEKEAVLDYWRDEFSELLNIKQSENVIQGTYSFYDELTYSYRIYDVSGDDFQDLLNYTYADVGIVIDNKGNLAGLGISNELTYADKVGDYPIISMEEAKQLLTDGKYYTSVSYKMPGEAYISDIKLLYRMAQAGEYLIPYYLFYVELPEEGNKNGLKTYGAYYVPAVKEDYILNMPVYDGRT